jgi:hypothetical protein
VEERRLQGTHLLPLEHRLLGDHVRRDTALQAAREEVVREVHHIVQRVGVGDDRATVLLEHTLVYNLHAAVLREKEGSGAPLAHNLVPYERIPQARQWKPCG